MTLDEACVALRALIVDAQNILNQLESKSSASPQPVQLHKRKRRVNPDVVQAPVLLDPSLHAFLVAINIDVPPLTEPISRYDVLKWMCAYVKNEALQVESNRKCFGFDQKLCDLFKRHVLEVEGVTQVEVHPLILTGGAAGPLAPGFTLPTVHLLLLSL